MNIAVLVFGQFRSAEEYIENNLQQLKLLCSDKNINYDIYILTDKLESGNYSKELETHLKTIIASHGFTIKMLEYWEDFQDCYTIEEILKNHMKHISNYTLDISEVWASCLWYRRYILWKRFECISNILNKNYDYVVFTRLFDTNMKCIKSLYPTFIKPESKDTLYFCIDTFFFSSPSTMKNVFMFGSSINNWKPFEWTEEFTKEMSKFDLHISKTKPTFSSEAQVFKYISTNVKKYENIRYDFSSEITSRIDDNVYLFIKIEKMNIIPKRILQIAIGDDYVRKLPLEKLKHNILIKHNKEYKYTLLTDASCESFLQESFPEYLDLYRSLHYPQHKSDLVRYLYLYTYGGYYIDIDILPLLPLYTIFEYSNNSPTFFSLSAHKNTKKGRSQVCNGFIGTRPKNPIFLELVKAIEEEPNPEDYGRNVQELYRVLAKSHPMTPFKSSNGIYIFQEVKHGAKYYIINSGKTKGAIKTYNREIIAHSNGHDYPFSV